MYNIKSYKLSHINHIIEIATQCPVYWYRGHSKTYGNLTPKVFRKEIAEKCFEEWHYFSMFKNEAKGIESKCPNDNDDLNWLFLMQHHGCSTRLLDWTERIFVALFFAVTKNMSDNGELWCLHPGELNQRSIGSNLIEIDSPQIRLLAKDAANGNYGGDRHVKIDSLPKVPIALTPSIWFRRGINQISRFTIHPKPNEGYSIEKSLDHPYLVRYLISSEYKRELADNLYFFGIRPSTMFPDLDGLSHEICYFANLVKRISCYPIPPKCDGELNE